MAEWWRSWHGAPSDPKWGVIARKAGVPRSLVVALAWSLLDMASKATPRGGVAGADPEELAIALDASDTDVAAAIAVMHEVNPATGEPRFIGADGRIHAWEKFQPKRERDEDDSTERVRDWRARNAGASQAEPAKRDVTPRNATREEKRREDISPPSPPVATVPAEAVDRVRKLVWTLVGKDQGWIGTKLVSTDVEGVRQVRGWFDLGLSEERVLTEVERVFSAAKEAGTSIGRPWAYLDRVMRSLAEEGSATAEAGGTGILDATPWVQRVESYRAKGFWVDGWGPRPGEDGCLVPADVLASHGYGARA